jgi:hypothetical protein
LWKAAAAVVVGVVVAVAVAAVVAITAPVSLPLLAVTAIIAGGAAALGVNQLLSVTSFCLSCGIQAIEQGKGITEILGAFFPSSSPAPAGNDLSGQNQSAEPKTDDITTA